MAEETHWLKLSGTPVDWLNMEQVVAVKDQRGQGSPTLLLYTNGTAGNTSSPWYVLREEADIAAVLALLPGKQAPSAPRPPAFGSKLG